MSKEQAPVEEFETLTSSQQEALKKAKPPPPLKPAPAANAIASATKDIRVLKGQLPPPTVHIATGPPLGTELWSGEPQPQNPHGPSIIVGRAPTRKELDRYEDRKGDLAAIPEDDLEKLQPEKKSSPLGFIDTAIANGTLKAKAASQATGSGYPQSHQAIVAAQATGWGRFEA